MAEECDPDKNLRYETPGHGRCAREGAGGSRGHASRLSLAPPPGFQDGRPKPSNEHALHVWPYEKGTVSSAFLDGAYRDRTGDLRLAKPALSQLS